MKERLKNRKIKRNVIIAEPNDALKVVYTEIRSQIDALKDRAQALSAALSVKIQAIQESSYPSAQYNLNTNEKVESMHQFISTLENKLQHMDAQISKLNPLLPHDIQDTLLFLEQKTALMSDSLDQLSKMQTEIIALDKEVFPGKIYRETMNTNQKEVEGGLQAFSETDKALMNYIQSSALQHRKEIEDSIENIKNSRSLIESNVRQLFTEAQSENDPGIRYVKIAVAKQQFPALYAAYQAHEKTLRDQIADLQVKRSHSVKEAHLNLQQNYLATMYALLIANPSLESRPLYQALAQKLMDKNKRFILSELYKGSHTQEEKTEVILSLFGEVSEVLLKQQAEIKAQYGARIDAIGKQSPLLFLRGEYFIEDNDRRLKAQKIIEKSLEVSEMALMPRLNGTSFDSKYINNIDKLLLLDLEAPLEMALNETEKDINEVKRQLENQFPALTLDSEDANRMLYRGKHLPTKELAVVYAGLRRSLFDAFEKGVSDKLDYGQVYKELLAQHNQLETYHDVYHKVNELRQSIEKDSGVLWDNLLSDKVTDTKRVCSSELMALFDNYTHEKRSAIEEQALSIENKVRQTIDTFKAKNKDLQKLQALEERITDFDTHIVKINESIESEKNRVRAKNERDPRLAVLGKLQEALAKNKTAIETQQQLIQESKGNIANNRDSSIQSFSTIEKSCFEAIKTSFEETLTDESMRKLSTSERFSILKFLEGIIKPLLNFVNLRQQPMNGQSLFTNKSETMMFEFKKDLMSRLDEQLSEVAVTPVQPQA